MLVLSMTSPSSHHIPTFVFKKANEFSNLHRTACLIQIADLNSRSLESRTGSRASDQRSLVDLMIDRPA